MQVIVRDNSVDQTMRALKRKMQREACFGKMRRGLLVSSGRRARARQITADNRRHSSKG